MADIKAGYKQTTIGIIPEDWNVGLLGDLGKTYGGLSGKTNSDFGHGDALYIPFMNIMDNVAIDTNFFEKVVIAQGESQQRVQKGDLFFNGSSETPTEVGMCSILTSEIANLYLNSFCFGFRLDSLKKFNGLWLAYLFRSDFGRRLVYSLAQGATRYNLSKNNFLKLRIPLPKPKEQEAIATVLSDVDGLIESLEQLIVKKRDIKTATMQQLLTGKKRLPGFDGEWKNHQIKEFTHCVAGGTPSTLLNEYWNGKIPWINSGELNKKFIHDVVGRITTLGLKNSSAHMIPEKCVLIGLAGQGKTRGTAAINFVPLSTNQSIAAIFPSKKFSSRYLYYNLENRYHELRELSSGSGGRGGLNLSIINNISIPFPSITEQTAIATILSDIDAEIDALEQRLNKAQNLKTGMMQELLTGKTRLIDNSHTHKPKQHSQQFEDAVIIAILADEFGSERYPLHRFRYTKFSYLLHRYAQQNTDDYLKKAAGPYNPKTRYGGAEKIAKSNKYVRVKNAGFITGDKINEAKTYFEKWFGLDALDWLKQFRRITNERLELWTTIDNALLDLRENNKEATVSNVKKVLSSNKEWQDKLNKEIFSDYNIQKAIEKSTYLFGE